MQAYPTPRHQDPQRKRHASLQTLKLKTDGSNIASTYPESENAKFERELARQSALLCRPEEQERESDQLSTMVEEKVKELEKSSVVRTEWGEKIESGLQFFLETSGRWRERDWEDG